MIQWTRTYGDFSAEWAWSICQILDGGFIIAGSTSSFGIGPTNGWLVRIDAIGDTLWTHLYGGDDYDAFRDVQETADGGYIAVGDIRHVGYSPDDVYIVKTNAFGDTLWTRVIGGESYDYGKSVRQTTDGGYIVAGSTSSFDPGHIVPSDIYLIRTNENGDTLWTNHYGGEDSDIAFEIELTSDGGYIIAGFTDSFGAGEDDIYLVRVDVNGDTLWTRTFGGLSGDYAWSVKSTIDGGYIMAGHTSSYGAGLGDFYVVKTGPDSYNKIDAINNFVSPKILVIHQSYPNPFNPNTTIQFDLNRTDHVTLIIYNTLGREIITLVDAKLTPGTYKVPFTAENLSSGIYFYTLKSSTYTSTRKMVLLK